MKENDKSDQKMYYRILGGKPKQLKENIGCLSVVENLTSEHMTDIDDILDNRPVPYAGFGGEGMRKIVTI